MWTVVPYAMAARRGARYAALHHECSRDLTRPRSLSCRPAPVAAMKPPAGQRGRPSALGAYETLLAAIEDGTLPPGSRLREVELAARFGISRTPVREALQRLEGQGLVAHEPNQGAMVTVLDYARIAELYDLREMLEGMAARLAAQHATPTEIEVLHAMVAHDRGLGDDPRELARRNKLFHRQIHRTARNRFLDGVLENMRLSLVLLAGTTLAIPERGGASIEEHAAVVAAIEGRDAEAAEAAARRHIREALRARIELQLHA